ncbi:hypothetical protein GCM10027347_07790 [Larkinella harenae]
MLVLRRTATQPEIYYKISQFRCYTIVKSANSAKATILYGREKLAKEGVQSQKKPTFDFIKPAR